MRIYRHAVDSIAIIVIFCCRRSHIMIGRRAWVWIIALILAVSYFITIYVFGPDTYLGLLGINALQSIAALFAAFLLFKRARYGVNGYLSNPWFFYALGASFYFTAQFYWTLYLI